MSVSERALEAAVSAYRLAGGNLPTAMRAALSAATPIIKQEFAAQLLEVARVDREEGRNEK